MNTEIKVAHTPGPWRTAVVDGCRSWIESADGLSVACVVSGGSDENTEANARLMATSPRLLDALNGMVGLIQLIQTREPELQQNHRFIEALAAIAEAEGQ